METEGQIEDFDGISFRHGQFCRCNACLASSMGKWIDGLADETSTGRWQVFGTATFRTPNYPWQKGFPTSGSYKPSPHFVHRTYDQLIRYLESQLGSSVDYVVADQLGSANGRLHQHFILAALGLDLFPRGNIWNHLSERAGFNRILPFERGAAYYIGRYVGRAVANCEWDFRLASHPSIPPAQSAFRGIEIVPSVALGKEAFKQTKKGRHR